MNAESFVAQGWSESAAMELCEISQEPRFLVNVSLPSGSVLAYLKRGGTSFDHVEDAMERHGVDCKVRVYRIKDKQ